MRRFAQRFSWSRRVRLAFGWIAVMAATGAAAEHSAGPPLAKYLPAGAVAYLEVDGAARIVERVRSSEYLKLLDGPMGRQFMQTPGYRRFEAGRKIFETQVGMDAWTFAQKVLGRNVALALYPKAGSKQPDFVGLVRTADKQTLEALRQRIEPFLMLAGDKVDLQQTIDDIKIISFDGKLFVGVRDDLLAAASSRALLERTIKVTSGKSSASLAGDPEFAALAKRHGGDHLAFGHVDVRAIAQSRGGGKWTPDKLDNVLSVLLFAAPLQLAGQARTVGIVVDDHADRLRLAIDVPGHVGKLAEQYRGLIGDGAGTPALPQVSGLLGGFALHRDFAGLYQKREQLVDPRILPAFDKFETGISTFLAGKKFGHDVLPLFGQNLTLVAAGQDYQHLPSKPDIQIPGFAVIVDLANIKEGSEILQLMFQTIVTIANLDSKNRGGQPMVMDGETYHGVQISYGKHLAPPKGRKLPIIYNFAPASAKVNDKFIFSTAASLCKDLIDHYQSASKNESAATGLPTNLDLTLHIGAASSVAEANRALIQARRIQEGRSVQEAAAEVDLLLKLIRVIKSVRLTNAQRPESFDIQLEVSWQ